MPTSHPIGYASRVVTLDQLRATHEPKMHPEFARRLFAWLAHHDGYGIGGGWRATQPDRPGFAPDGKSFHQNQTFASGFVGYCAVDLVVADPGKVHRAPTWAETVDAPNWGLHTFITNEPWHMQPIEIRGWQTWVNAGRPDPPRFKLPGDTPETTPPAPPPPIGEPMAPYVFKLADNSQGIRHESGARHLNTGELEGPLAGEKVWPVPAGSNWEVWIKRELGRYERELDPPTVTVEQAGYVGTITLTAGGG